MNESWKPWKTLAASVGVGVLTPEWTLDKSPGDEEGDCRVFSYDVAFADAFSMPPVVSWGITGFDLDQRDSGRLSVKVRDVTREGFTMDITAWRGSRVYAVELSWLAVGA